MKKKDKPIDFLEGKFDSTILGRGRDYYREGRVSKVNKIENSITSKVRGNRLYSQKIDLDSERMHCTCPYEGNYCKHLAALVLWLKANKPLEVNDVTGVLKSKSKGELVSLIKEMLSKNPDLSRYILKPNKDEVKRMIKQLWLTYEEDEFEERLRFIKEQAFLLRDDALQILLLRKLIDILDHCPNGVIDEYLEKYLLELEKMKLSKEQKMKIREVLDKHGCFDDYF